MPTSGGGIDRREALRIVAAAGVSLAAGGGVVREWLRRGGLVRVRRTEARLGTLVSIVVMHPEAAAARQAVDDAFTRIASLEGILSRHDPSSALSQLNREGRLEAPPEDLVRVLRTAERVAQASAGAFDVTVLPLLRLHARHYGRAGRGPSDAEIRRVLERVDARALRTTPASIALERPGMEVTLDGIAKGYVVDRTVEGLVDAGFSDVLVDAGGDIATAGTGEERSGWQVALDPSEHVGGGLVRLRGGAIATSGDATAAFTEDRTAHHILDPRTGRSPVGTASVSVRAASAMEADALSTAAMVLGPVAGVRMVDGWVGAEATVTGKDGSATGTAGWG